MKSNIDKSFLKLIGLWFFIGILINAFCFLLYFFPSHAESSYFPMNQNDNNNIPEAYYSIFDSYLDSENNYIVVRNGEVFSDGLGFWYIYYPKQDNYGIFAELNSDGHSFSFYNIGSNPQYVNGRLSITYDGQVFNNVYSQNPFTNFWNVESSLYSTSYSYISNFRIYSNNNPDTTQLVLKYGSDDSEIILGEAIPPHEIERPFYLEGHSRPESVPNNITYNSYSWTTYNPPSVDNSGIIEVINSEIQVINYLMGWLKDNIHGEFSTVLANLLTSFNNIAQNIQYFGGLILDVIITGIQNFYDNMVSLFQNFFDKFGEPLDTEAVQEAYEETSIYTLVSIGTNFKNTYSTFFDSVVPVNSLTFSIPYTILNKSGYVVVDFSWYNNIRDSVVPWIVGFLYAGFGLSLFRSLPSIIHGLSGVMQKGA